jgi:hypothetical protein
MVDYKRRNSNTSSSSTGSKSKAEEDDSSPRFRPLPRFLLGLGST